MTNMWDERKKALENEYFHKKEREALAKFKQTACLGHCPKCGGVIEPITFRGVSIDRCPDCGGVWLGPNDLRTLAEKDCRSWFERWLSRDG